jgi:hypothetical protein
MYAGLIALNSNAHGLIAFGTDQHHIRDMDRPLELNTAGVDLAATLCLDLALVLRTNVDTLHHNAVILRQQVDDFPALAFVFEATTDNFDGIAFADFHSHCTLLLR